MSLRDLAGRIGLAKPRPTPSTPGNNAPKPISSSVPSPAPPADYPTPQSPISRKVGSYAKAPLNRVQEENAFDKQTSQRDRPIQDSTAGIKRPHSPDLSSHREVSLGAPLPQPGGRTDFGKMQAKRSSRTFARQPTASSSRHSQSYTDLAPSDSASNVKKGKHRANPSTGTGETSELLVPEDYDEGGSKPPSNVSELYIPSTSANNIIPLVL